MRRLSWTESFDIPDVLPYNTNERKQGFVMAGA
jgi:hypothetical protein